MTSPERFILIDDEKVANMLAERSIRKVFEESAIIKFTEPEKGLYFIMDECLLPALTTVVFLDINMPILSGWEVIYSLEQLACDVTSHFKIYIVSSSVDPADKEKARISPLVKGYLEKPITRSVVESLFMEKVAS